MSNRKVNILSGLSILTNGSKALINSSNNDNHVVAKELPLTALFPCRFQPRKKFPNDALNELADSMRKYGVLQPIICREENDNKYEIIAGERRWRAAELACLKSVPVIVRDVDDETVACFVLIENIQREGLDPIEEAEAYKKLIHEFKLSHEDVAKRVGKPRSTISNSLRLLELHIFARNAISTGELSVGHGKILATLEHPFQEAIAKKSIEKKWSVRTLENHLSSIEKQNNSVKPTNATYQKPVVDNLNNELSKITKRKTKISFNQNGRGKIVVEVNSISEIEDFLNLFK